MVHVLYCHRCIDDSVALMHTIQICSHVPVRVSLLLSVDSTILVYHFDALRSDFALVLDRTVSSWSTFLQFLSSILFSSYRTAIYYIGYRHNFDHNAFNYGHRHNNDFNNRHCYDADSYSDSNWYRYNTNCVVDICRYRFRPRPSL